MAVHPLLQLGVAALPSDLPKLLLPMAPKTWSLQGARTLGRTSRNSGVRKAVGERETEREKERGRKTDR